MGSLLARRSGEHILELEEATLAVQPFGSEYGAFGEAATRFRVVGEHHGVVRRIEEHDVRADHVSLADAGDLELFAARLFDDLLDARGGAGRCILLPGVVALNDVPGVAMV